MKVGGGIPQKKTTSLFLWGRRRKKQKSAFFYKDSARDPTIEHGLYFVSLWRAAPHSLNQRNKHTCIYTLASRYTYNYMGISTKKTFRSPFLSAVIRLYGSITYNWFGNIANYSHQNSSIVYPSTTEKAYQILNKVSPS